MAFGVFVLGTIQLHVFRKIDGGRLRSGAGPLKPVPSGLENFGTRVFFSGR